MYHFYLKYKWQTQNTNEKVTYTKNKMYNHLYKIIVIIIRLQNNNR